MTAPAPAVAAAPMASPFNTSRRVCAVGVIASSSSGAWRRTRRCMRSNAPARSMRTIAGDRPRGGRRIAPPRDQSQAALGPTSAAALGPQARSFPRVPRRDGSPTQYDAVMDPPRSRTLPDLLDEIAARDPGHEFIVSGSQRLSYADTRARARQLARGLRSLGVRRGDTVALLMSNRPEWLLVDFAVALLGATLVPISTWSRPRELGYVLDH